MISPNKINNLENSITKSSIFDEKCDRSSESSSSESENESMLDPKKQLENS